MTQYKAPADTAFVIVDPQKGFCPGGNLAVPGGNEIIAAVNRLKKLFSTVFITQDWHPQGHSSFFTSHPGKNPFETTETSYGTQVLWPEHCIQDTEDAAFHADLAVSPSDIILRKGTNKDIDSYSAFFENDRKTQPRFEDGQTFAEKARAKGIRKLVFSGLDFDYCVGWNALDAVSEGFDVTIIVDATRAIASESEKAMREKLVAAGVKLVTEQEYVRSLATVKKHNPGLSGPM